jgi:hypothetical protein
MKKPKFALSLIMAVVVAVTLTALPVSSNLGGENVSYAEGSDYELSEDEIKEKFATISYPFIENKGIYDEKAEFYTFIESGSFFVADDGLYYTMANGEDSTYFEEVFIDGQWNDIKLTPSGDEENYMVFNHFLGKDESKWGQNLPTYNRLNLGEIYPNIEAKLKVENKNIEKLFHVYEGGNPEGITIKVKEAEKVSLKEGNLVVKKEYGEVVMTKPVAFQEIDGEKKNVEVNYVVRGDRAYGFELGEYDKNNTLIIDPVTLINIAKAQTYELNPLYTSYVGGSGEDEASGVYIDSSDNKVVAGTTTSTDAPWTGVITGVENAVAVKFAPDMESISATGVFGGSAGDSSFTSISAGTDYYIMAGQTGASDYPTTAGSYNQTLNGSSDITLTKTDLSFNLGAVGAAALVVGGSEDDEASNAEVNLNGDIVMCGITRI